MRQRFDSAKERFGLHYHSSAAAEWTVINLMMPVISKIPQIMDVDGNQLGLDRPANNSKIKDPAKNLRKNCNKVKLHNCWKPEFRSQNPGVRMNKEVSLPF